MDELAIQTLGLTKFYGKQRGIEGIDLAVTQGEVFGFLGPNGAGKSTTIRLLLDLIRPTAGAASVLGLNPRVQALEVRRRVGYVPGDLEMYYHMTGRQLCRYFASLRGRDLDMMASLIADRLDLDLDRQIGGYSTGNRQKVGLTQAMMHEPEVLILDEPTSGLDPLVRQEFYALVDEVRSSGRTVFLSSHLLPEVERVADRVAIVRDGKVVVTEDVAVLKRRAVRRVEIRFGHQVDPRPFEMLDAVHQVNSADDQATLIMVVEGSIDEVIKQAATHQVHNIVSHDGDLEDVFLDYYRMEDSGRQTDRSTSGGTADAGDESNPAETADSTKSEPC